ncbi:hypothetical protein L873DRAFT_1394356 [Choiromyces venosus 120613-1]|uniref:Uncharacterized protein n=1 Tax=Choiromyces venosus 120613-1 TaxID=1336337 RepID=A0A3N4JCS1_9PEZI|nr:hypothetical protein L873DRAFT_1394356 [Choiromyces venosus 120613-1]
MRVQLSIFGLRRWWLRVCGCDKEQGLSNKENQKLGNDGGIPYISRNVREYQYWYLLARWGSGAWLAWRGACATGIIISYYSLVQLLCGHMTTLTHGATVVYYAPGFSKEVDERAIFKSQ